MNTEAYKPPTEVIKTPDGDTGFKIVKKAYRRWIWTWNDYKKKLQESEMLEIPMQGSSGVAITSGTVGYKSGPLSSGEQLVGGRTDLNYSWRRKKKKTRKK